MPVEWQTHSLVLLQFVFLLLSPVLRNLERYIMSDHRSFHDQAESQTDSFRCTIHAGEHVCVAGTFKVSPRWRALLS